MKTTELQELFASANTAQDIIAIFEANPGLEDEILELGKKQGINLDEPRELTDLELELVAGGLNLKKGVVTTLAGLMIVSSIAGPLAQTRKAHAATVDNGKPVAVQVENQNITSNEASTETGEATSNSPDSNSPGPEGYQTNDYLYKLKTAYQAAGASSIEAIAKALSGGSGIAGVLGKTGAEIFKVFTSSDKTQEDKTKDLIQESTKLILDSINNTERTILKDNSVNTKSIKDHIKFNTDKIINQAEKQQCDEALKDFATNLANIGDTLNQTSIKEAFDNMATPNGYKYNATTIDPAFESIYSGKSGNKQEYGTRFLVRHFKSASDWITGENIGKNNVTIMDIKKMSLSEGNKCDNETIEDRKAFLDKLKKIYLSQYVYIRCLIDYECGKCAKKWVAEYTKNAEDLPAGTWEKYANNENWFKEVDAKIRKVEEGAKNDRLETLDKKYSNRIKNAQDDLLTIDNLCVNVLKQINAEYKGLEYESNNKDTYVLGNKAFKIAHTYSDNHFANISGNTNTHSSLENLTKTVGDLTIQFKDHNIFKGRKFFDYQYYKIWLFNISCGI